MRFNARTSTTERRVKQNHKQAIRLERTRGRARQTQTDGGGLPVLNSGEGLLAGDVIHEQEAHGAPVVGCGDGPVALLACCVLHKHTGNENIL